jgi:ketosteroid isomerase-like protein
MAQEQGQENFEVLRRWFEAQNNEDFDAAIAMVHPEIEFVPPGGQPAYRGATRVRRWMEPDALQGQVVEPLECEAAADGSILVKVHVTARGASSGIELDTFSWCVCSFDEQGRITHFEIFLEHEEEEARQAAGL